MSFILQPLSEHLLCFLAENWRGSLAAHGLVGQADL